MGELTRAPSQEVLEEVKKILKEFNIIGNVVSIDAVKSGRINTTYKVKLGQIGGFCSYVIQKINTQVFKNPDALMTNIIGVTKWLEEHEKCTLCFRSTKKKEYAYFDGEQYWRVYDFIDATMKNNVDTIEDTYSLGEAIGHFCEDMEGFDANDLHETIQDFHNTPARYENFQSFMSVAYGTENFASALLEVYSILERAGRISTIQQALDKGEIPTRVSHNDTKLNNVLFNPYDGKFLCWIDLDTVMPGSILYDFGDAARASCNTESEDATTTENVSFDLVRFEALTRGFLNQTKSVITREEVNLLATSVWTITYELALRFLYDHIDGDKYFGVECHGQNLERARIQIALLKDIETKEGEMEDIVLGVWNEIK